jgi:transcriptional regulator with XRE-family HTH domain
MDPLSGRLRQIRKQAGLTQRQLEAQSGVPQNTISRIEIEAVQDVSAKTLANLARALHVSMDHLFGLDSEPEPQVKRKSSKPRVRTSTAKTPAPKRTRTPARAAKG